LSKGHGDRAIRFGKPLDGIEHRLVALFDPGSDG